MSCFKDFNWKIRQKYSLRINTKCHIKVYLTKVNQLLGDHIDIVKVNRHQQNFSFDFTGH